MSKFCANVRRPLIALTLLLLGGVAVAQVLPDAPDAILARLLAARPDLAYGKPVPSKLPGLFEVQVVDGPMLYVSADGSHFLAGDLFAVQGAGRGFANLAEQQRQQERKNLIAEIKEQDMIVFAPPNPKATLTVFTDVDCGYCRKLHQEVPELNRMGIAVHYLAFPRDRVGSPSYRKIVSAWCSADRKAALTTLKNGGSIPDTECPANPVAAQKMLGERVGVTGTPALVFEDGTLVPGYQPAKELAQALGVE